MDQLKTINYKLKTLFIVGPTASGKSALAIEVAKSINGEIICADSRTVYTGLDVSTAKPTATDRAEVPHWGLDLVKPDQSYSAADFKEYAQSCIADIQKRGKIPIIVGGTGLYIDGLFYDFKFGPAKDTAQRKKLEELSIEQLLAIISDKKLETPENSKNKRYLIRAIEQGGVNKQKNAPIKDALIIGLAPDRKILTKRIADRAYKMLEDGALKEAEWLFNTYGQEAPAASSPFFKSYKPYFFEAKSIEECTGQDIIKNRQLAKRQLTWFKRNSNTKWFEDTKDAHNFVISQF